MVVSHHSFTPEIVKTYVVAVNKELIGVSTLISSYADGRR
jgi:hypothetical protein